MKNNYENEEKDTTSQPIEIPIPERAPQPSSPGSLPEINVTDNPEVNQGQSPNFSNATS